MRSNYILLLSALMVPGFMWATQAGQGQSGAGANQQAMDIANTVNQAEMKMGQYMKEHGSSSTAKQYAAELDRDHTNAENRLKAIVGGDIGSDVDPTLQQTSDQQFNEVQKMHGSQADRYFEQVQVADHQQVIGQLQTIEPNISDPKLKSYVQWLLPVLQKHLRDGKKAEGAD